MADEKAGSMREYVKQGDGSYAKQVSLTGSDVQNPVEIQGVYTEQEKTLSAASVGAGGTVNFTSFPVNMAGFTEFGAVCVASASHTYTLNVLPSPDGTTTLGDPITSKAGTSSGRRLDVSKSPCDYIVYQIINNDTAARTYDIWTRKMN